MASDRDIHTISQDPSRARSIARGLLKGSRAALTEWELDFLEDMAERLDDEPLTYRQAEKLVEIRDDNEVRDRYRDYSVRGLVRSCWQARLDLGQDEDIAFIERLNEDGVAAVKRRQLGRLARCARELGVIESYA